jgi:hypothetical protein
MGDCDELQRRIGALETLVNSLVVELASRHADPLQCVQEMRDKIVERYENDIRNETLPHRFTHGGTVKAIAQQFDEIEKSVASMIA